ncbi:GNAT family N-acetyltransferase [Saccharopolyspora sp. NPDC047091]|uniref:GNAT family N-acetyltransferase n=1 Tax=Saccharopolyspora sp. NPDC047091 TaxID=3155924 RepID=UPI0033F1C47D
MLIREFVADDLSTLIDLTIRTFRPFYEDVFRPLVGEVVFTHQHGAWREDYHDQVAALHAPERNAHVAVAVGEDGITGYVAWSVEPPRRNGTITLLAVDDQHRARGVGAALCEHAFAEMRARGAEVVEIGTGGDAFHAPARALYERLGCTPLPVVAYYRRL